MKKDVFPARLIVDVLLSGPRLDLIEATLTPLVLTAMLSQFAASVADAIAGTGGIREVVGTKVSKATCYAIIGGLAIALTWGTNTYQILALASRAFAFYYFLQVLIALMLAKSLPNKVLFGALVVLLAFVTVCAVPVH